MRSMEVVQQGGKTFLRTPDFVDHVVLAANTAENYTLPLEATYGRRFFIFSASAPFYAGYIKSDEENLVTNGTFASDTSWTKGTGWTIAAGVATSDASQAANSDLTQSFANLVVGRSYSVAFTVSGYSAGNVRALVGGATGTNRAADGTFTETIIASNTNLLVGLRADLDFAGNIDNVTISPIAIVPGADLTGGGGNEYNPTQRFIGSDVTKMSFISPSTCVVTIAVYNQ